MADTSEFKYKLTPAEEVKPFTGFKLTPVEEIEGAQSDPEYDRGTLLPIVKNRDTGEVSFGLPEIINTPIEAAVNFVGAGRDGTLLDPDTGHVRQSVIEDSLEAATFSPASKLRALSKGAIATKLTGQAQRNVDQAGEQGIDISRGQATRDFRAQAFEEDALTGGHGRGAQATIEAQRAAQRGQVDTATENIIDRVSPSRVGDEFEAGENVAMALRSQAEQLKSRSNAFYKSAENANAELAPESIGVLSNSLRTALDDAGAMVGDTVAEDFRVVGRALSRVDNLLSKAPEGDIVGVGWQNVERIRKMITNSRGATADEGRALKAMRTSIDDWIETSVENSLISGDPKFLGDLKQARGLWRQYKEIVGNESSIVRKMADGSANSEQIANWLYGAQKVGGRADSSNTLREIKRLIGADNAAIEDLKRGVLMRLFNDRQGNAKTYGKLSGDIMEFSSSKGRELAKELYGEKGIVALRRFAGVLKNLTPDPIATNPSRSGQTMMRRISDAANEVAPFIGWTVSGLSGVLAGFGFRAASKAKAGLAAKKAVTQPVPFTSRLAPPVATSLGLRGNIALSGN